VIGSRPRTVLLAGLTLAAFTGAEPRGRPSTDRAPRENRPASCPARGSCVVEAHLGGRTDLALVEDWNDERWPHHWTGVEERRNLRVVTVDGRRALRVRVPRGEHDGATLHFSYTSAGLPEPEEAYLRYHVRFAETWRRRGGGEIGKLPGFGGTYGRAGWGGRRANGRNGWSARLMVYDRGATVQVGFYTYHADMGAWGEHMLWPASLERNRWYCLEARVRLNSIAGSRGNPDGILEGWVDDRLVFSQRDLRFRDTDALKIEKAWGNVYVGGAWTADRDMALYLGDVVIARSRIGCGAASRGPAR
jgi:hypothetical protein